MRSLETENCVAATLTTTVSNAAQPSAFIACTMYSVVTDGVAMGLKMFEFESELVGVHE